MAYTPGSVTEWGGYKTSPYSADFLYWLDQMTPKTQKTIDYGNLGGESGMVGKVDVEEKGRPAFVSEDLWKLIDSGSKKRGQLGSFADISPEERDALNQYNTLSEQEWIKNSPVGQEWSAKNPGRSIHSNYKHRGPSTLETLTPALFMAAAGLGMAAAPALFGAPAAAGTGAGAGAAGAGAGAGAGAAAGNTMIFDMGLASAAGTGAIGEGSVLAPIAAGASGLGSAGVGAGATAAGLENLVAPTALGSQPMALGGGLPAMEASSTAGGLGLGKGGAGMGLGSLSNADILQGATTAASFLGGLKNKKAKSTSESERKYHEFTVLINGKPVRMIDPRVVLSERETQTADQDANPLEALGNAIVMGGLMRKYSGG